MSDKVQRESPSDFLKSIMGKEVVVKINTNADFSGRLVSLDGFMNLAMEQTREIVNGRVRSDPGSKNYGDAFIRGNNVMYIAPATTSTATDDASSL